MKKLIIVLFVLIFLFSSIGSGGLASIVPEDIAPVVVDGNVLFNIGPIGQYRAQERARITNQMIAQQIRQKKTKLEVIKVDDRAIIQTQDRRGLLTVTPEDVINEIDAFSQAQLWSDRLETALETALIQRSPNAFWRNLGLSLATILLTLLLSLGLLRIFKSWWRYGAITLLFMINIISGTILFPQLRSWRYQLGEFFQKTYLADFSISRILLLIITLIIYSILLQFLLKKITMSKSVKWLLGLMGNLVGWLIIAKFWGLELGLIIVGIGLLFWAIANQLPGIIISLEKPFELGDIIEIDGLTGTVVNIGLANTAILTLNQTQLTIPNRRFLESNLLNWSRGNNNPVRICISVFVSYGTELQNVKAFLLEAAKNHPDVLTSPRPVVLLQELSAHSIELQLLFWIEARDKQQQIKSELLYRIESSLRRHQKNEPQTPSL